MIIYDYCNNVEFEKVHEAFQIGFSDYMIKLELSKEDFLKRFFGPEGNRLEHSFIALDEGKPVGVILGGIKEYEGVKTIRCGTLCIHPDYRGKGISKNLFDLHKKVALDNECKQMFLEVIVGNDRAINFYRNLGYEKIYDIKYYSHKDPHSLHEEIDNSIDIEEIAFDRVVNLSVEIKDIHVNWQNDFDYLKKLEGLVHYGVYEGSRLIGALSITSNGKIFFLWTESQFRHRGIARSLITKAVDDLKLNNLSISFPNNARIEGFVKSMKFQRDKISQYEMYLTI
ncbi:GNAT family N-acetyltransferase [Tissierella sp.]|uniref:GNAT family N-acetyltransferase n=1 Tax=Tissierella sp. TaxID=41274 RepID=UPI00285947C9|nr:GNAT family N-acetyltransferase [Tissierella sp.]MDR7855071.1 GNAT family N-acetyltransferase [Tissierella sp.]